MASELYEKRREQMFPKLAAAQIARLEAHGVAGHTDIGAELLRLHERPSGERLPDL